MDDLTDQVRVETTRIAIFEIMSDMNDFDK